MSHPLKNLILDALHEPQSAIVYSVSQRLAAMFPERAVIQGNSHSFELEDYAEAGHCRLEENKEIHSHISTGWYGGNTGIFQTSVNVWYEVSWQGRTLDVLFLTYTSEGCAQKSYFILADNKEIAETFLQSVCEWCSEIRGEVLVFRGGFWDKSEELYQSIKSATFENLILAGALKQEIKDDFVKFFAARALYDHYGIPWKRGVLFIGAPGNGKTHTVKSLINWLGQPCLYVQSFKSRHDTDHASIREVFDRARKTTPCILVLEDLDSLINDGNRSYFLNELDGFAANTGIVVLATTNHPERLDPAILERPSRFDRKYTFALPEAEERRAYLALWNDTLQADTQLSVEALGTIAGLTEGYSFAYLKELVLSSLMRWIAAPQQRMGDVMSAQAEFLRQQMHTAAPTSPSNISDEGGEEFTFIFPAS